jgi:glycosyltransferase involved in cell wall biosynthesis
MGPTVAVVIPAYNCADYLPGALDSVLAQEHPADEIIVVDDGSSDATPQLLAGYGNAVTVLRQTQGGVSRARNAGVERTRADVIAFLDADDRWQPDRLRLGVQCLREHPDVGLVFSDFDVIDAEGHCLRSRGIVREYGVFTRHGLTPRTLFDAGNCRPLPGHRGGDRSELDACAGDAYKALFLGNFIITSSVMVRREAWRACGPFNQERRTQEDYEFFLAVARRYPLAYIDAALIDRRRRPGQLTSPSQSRAIAENVLGVLEAETSVAGPRLGPQIVNRRLSEARHVLALTLVSGGEPARARAVLAAAPAPTRASRMLWLWSFIPARFAGLLRRLLRAPRRLLARSQASR